MIVKNKKAESDFSLSAFYFPLTKKSGGDDGIAALSLTLIAPTSGGPQTCGRSTGIPLSFARVWPNGFSSRLTNKKVESYF